MRVGRTLVRRRIEWDDDDPAAAEPELSPLSAGHSRRTILPDLVRSLHPMILDLELTDEEELAALDRAVRAHLADPRTPVMLHLLVVT
jgi:hypothetical protein